jgi:hypothetical protein
MSEIDATRPVDEPHTRTRMAWGRTMLAMLIVALLLGRSAYVNDASWAMGSMLVIVLLIAATWLFRGQRLRVRVPAPLRVKDVTIVTLGTACLALLGAALVIFGAGR